MNVHTPGPWVAKRHDGYLETDWRIKPAHPIKGSTIGFAPHIVIKGDVRIVSEAEKEANAHLVAAAPDLLDALKAMHDAFRFTSHNDGEDTANECARLALAKATGESA